MTRSLDVEHAALLAGVELFAGLDRVMLAKLAAHLQSVPLKAGVVLYHEGDPGDAFYLVSKGAFGVYTAGPEGVEDRRVAVLRAGQSLGEMALLTNDPRVSTIRAETDGEVLRLDRVRFLDLIRREPTVTLAIAGTLSRRLASMHRRQGKFAPAAKQPALPEAAGAALPEEAGAPAPRRPDNAVIGGALAVAVLIVGWLMPAPAGLSLTGWHALVPLIAVVPALALDAIPEGILALALACMWVLGGVVPAPTALSGFASESWVLVVCVLAVGAAIASSGLLYRLALWTVANSRGGYVGQVLALGVAGLLTGPAVPNATGRVTLVAPALAELVEALGHAPRSRAAAGLSMAALIGFGQMAAVFLTSSTTAVLVFAVLPTAGRGDLNWVTWAVYAAPANLILFLGLMAVVAWWYRPRGRDAETAPKSGALALQRALLGPPSRQERVSLAVAVALLLGFMTQPLHGAHPAWVAVLALAVLAATRVVSADTLRAVNWSFALLFGMLAGIAEVFSSTGVDRWLAGFVALAVGDLSGAPVLFVAVLTLLCFVVSLFLRWQAAAPLITIAIGPVAAEAGISALVVGLVALIACNGFFLPYQSTTYLALYHGTGGRLFSHAQARPIAVAYGIVTLLALCLSVPAWRAMGLL